MGSELLWATTISSESAEKRVDLVLRRPSIDVSEVVEKVFPIVVGCSPEELVELCIVASGELRFEEGEFVLGSCGL